MINVPRDYPSCLLHDRVGYRPSVSGSVAVFVLYLVAVSPLPGQDNLLERSNPTEKDGQAVYVTTHGLGRYRPGRWGTLLVDATNRAKQPAVAESVVWVEGRVDEQFGRAVWLPPESRRLSWQPVLTPPQSSNQDTPELYWVSVRKEGGREVLSTAVNHDRIESRALNLTSSHPVFAVIGASTDEYSPVSGLLVYALEQLRPLARVIHIVPGQMPVTAEALDAADYLVVMGDELSQNAAAVEATQNWIQQGGRIWLMLDTMSAEAAQIICGGDLQIQEIDRTSLTSYSLTSFPRGSTREPDTVQLERPVQLVRTLTENVNVLCTVDSWPAIVATSFGRGRVFASMVSLNGVFVPRSRLEPEQASHLDQRLWTTTAAMDLLSALDVTNSEVPLDTEAMTEYVTGRVGYHVPVRTSGGIVLSLFCTSLAVICLTVHRYRRPLALIPGIAIASTVTVIAFLIMASMSRTTTDSTIMFQLAEATGIQDQLQVTGVTAFHSRDTVQPQIQSTAAGMMRFDGSVGAGGPTRMRWTDQHTWQLKNATLAPGVRLARLRQPVNVPEPVVVKGTFNESGFHGQLHGGLDQEFSDVLLADQTAFTLPAAIDSAGNVVPSESGSLPPRQYIAATTLNAEQSRRQDIYRRMFDVSQRSRIYPERPMLFAWTEPLKLSTGRVDENSQAGAMLISIPIVIERPQPGTPVRIPSTFLPYRSVSSRKSRVGTASNFSNTRRTWSPSSTTETSTALLRFQVPATMIPLGVDRASLKLKISAPLREVTVSSGNRDAMAAIWTRNSPVGTFNIPLMATSSQQLDADGGFYVALKVGNVQLDALEQSEQGTQDRNWLVDSMQLEIEGVIQ